MSDPMPGEGLPPSRLDEARAALFDAAARVWKAIGWPAEQATPFPPGQPVAPCAFVDVPTVHQAPDQRSGAVAATFPVVFVADGAEESQLRMIDRLMAYGWQELAGVQAGIGTPTVQSAGPEDVDVGPGSARSVVFRVQVTLQRKTLCPQPLAQTTPDGGDTP